MFARFDATDLVMVTATHENRGRSRLRMPENADSHREGVATAPAVSNELWSTGEGACDAWLKAADCDPDVLQRFAMMPQPHRKRIILKCMTRAPDNLEAWLNACVRNFVNKTQLERQALGRPTRRAIPTARVAQGSDYSPTASSSARSSHEGGLGLHARPTVSTPSRDLRGVTTDFNANLLTSAATSSHCGLATQAD